MRQSWETMTSISAGHIILTLPQPVGSGRPQRESKPGPPNQESCDLQTELPRPPSARKREREMGEGDRSIAYLWIADRTNQNKKIEIYKRERA